MASLVKMQSESKDMKNDIDASIKMVHRGEATMTALKTYAEPWMEDVSKTFQQMREKQDDATQGLISLQNAMQRWIWAS